MEYESDGNIVWDWYARYSHQKIGTRTGKLGNGRTHGDRPKYSIVDIGQNTKKSPGLRKLAVTHTPVRNHLLVLV